MNGPLPVYQFVCRHCSVPSAWFLYPIQIKNLKDPAISDGWVLKQQLCKTLSKSPYCMLIFELNNIFKQFFGPLFLFTKYLVVLAKAGIHISVDPFKNLKLKFGHQNANNTGL